MFGFLRKLFGGQADPAPAAAAGRLGIDDLARWLEVPLAELRATHVAYQRFHIPKRSGGTRTILAPQPQLKALQRRILHRLLSRLRAHACATGFERGHSIVTNAVPHAGQEVVIRLDLKDFFFTTSAQRVDRYFRAIGWDADAAALLTRLCTFEASLPPGAPTSPRLSNLVNWRLDARLFAAAQARGAAYSRYADDITFSGPQGATGRVNDLISLAKRILEDEGYELHTDKKLRIARRPDRQIVTGLVVNARVNLPRRTRRRLRAIEHRLRTNGRATMTASQISGWRALLAMIDMQRDPQQ